MKYDTNDPKLTAYALGELPEAERADIERELVRNPEARKAVDELRALAGQLETHYAAEDQPALSDDQRRAIGNAAAETPRGNLLIVPRRYWVGLSAAAALLVIAFGLNHMRIAQDEAARVASIEAGNGRSMLKQEMMAFEEVEQLEDQVWDGVAKSPVDTPAGDDDFRLNEVDLNVPTEPKAEFVQMSPKPTVRTENDRLDPSAVSPMKGMGLYASRPGRGRKTSRTLAGKEYHASAPMIETPDESAIPPSRYGPSIEDYSEIRENPFRRVADYPLSTFSIDVDTAAYANMRRFLKAGHWPPKDAVRIEELINYFDYSYEPPQGETPFATHLESAACPWNPAHRLVRIGLKGRVIEQDARPPLNLVFLLDVSGSMQNQNKLPLVKRAMTALVNQLDERDRVSMVVYAGASGLVLPPTSGADKRAIIEALDRLRSGGSTNGGAGIELAYATALEHFAKEGVNRVILCTDGDFNVGVTQRGDLVRMIEDKAKQGVFLSVLGFGMGNYKDSTLEQLSGKGNGNYAYIDTFSEARKVLVEQMSGTLVTIAKDVKIQVEFNPAQVAGYRLIGYENRMLKKEDFNDDQKDAGEIGAGHTVTALYELVPVGRPVGDVPAVDDLKYQVREEVEIEASNELLTVKLRYKQPDGDTSTKVEFPLNDDDRNFAQASEDYRFASAVAAFGMILRESEHKGTASLDDVIEWAAHAQGADAFGYRREFVDLVRNAKAIR